MSEATVGPTAPCLSFILSLVKIIDFQLMIMGVRAVSLYKGLLSVRDENRTMPVSSHYVDEGGILVLRHLASPHHLIAGTLG